MFLNHQRRPERALDGGASQHAVLGAIIGDPSVVNEDDTLDLREDLVHVMGDKNHGGALSCETPDGRGRSRLEAGARLARMICEDMDRLGAARVTEIAEHTAHAQLRQVVSGLRQVRRRLGAGCPRLAVLAGQGAFLAREAADAVGLVTTNLADGMGPAAARATPAAAVAYLLERVIESRDPRLEIQEPQLNLVP